jgi:hypothetical protein
MAMVKVINDNTHPFIGQFKDEEINIPAQGHILMNPTDALAFKGAYSPMKKTATGQPDPKYFKMIRIEENAQPVVEPKKYICQFDGKEFLTEKELENYIDENHLDKLQDQEFAQKRRGRPKKAI